MKRTNRWINIFKKLKLQTHIGFYKIRQNKINSQIVVLFLVYSMLIPIWFFGNTQATQAQSNFNQSPPISFAPPVPFNRSDNFSNNLSLMPFGYSIGVLDWLFSANESNESRSLENNLTTYSLTAAPNTVSVGEAITVNWSAPAGHSASDWISIYKVGDPNTTYGEWFRPTTGTSGTMTFTAPTLTGQYEFRYLLNDGYTSSATSNIITVGSPTPTPTPTPAYSLTATPNTVSVGEAITVNWSAPAGHSASDWISIYKVGDPNTTYGEWFRPTTGTSGTMTFTAPTLTGQYEFRYLLDNGYMSSATSGNVLVTTSSSGGGASLSKARLEPINSTGGTNLYSRNFGWGTGIAGLPGRSGLDAGFGLSYNSLMWVKDGSTMVFDPDISTVSPGFRMGFPIIEPSYADTETGKNTFLMVTPSGGRVEFRQVGSTNKYETPDSSYGEITLNSSSSITVRGTDGTQVFYTLIGGAFFVNQIKDSNGNYITVSHDSGGNLLSVTDTLGRVINVNYSAGYPSTVTQTWKNNNGAGSNVTYTYATLSYVNITVTPSFHSSLTLSGLTSGTSVKVLDKVTYPNGAYTKFDYNNFGQVWKVTNYAADNHKLNHVATNLDAPGTSLLDVPRFSSTKVWTENFNQNTSGVEQEVVIPNTFQTGQSYAVPGATGTGTLVQVTAPDGTISKTYFHESSWSEGLPVVTEDWASSVRKRWTWTNWTQDNTGVNYVLNPRVTESKVGDTTNTKRTTISYHMLSGNISKWGLVNEVKAYDSNQTTVLKKSVTDYNLATTYTDKRIIGLPSETKLYEGTSTLMSKVTYAYDEGNFSDSTLQQNISPINHDTTNYSSSFIAGRGNLTSMIRWDVTAPTSTSLAVTSSIKYNTAGSPVAQVNPLNYQSKLIYADSFNDSVNRNSYAYPTKVYDPAGNYSEVKYRYDMGANVWAKSPAPAGNTSGKETTREYDSLGRLTKDKIVNTGAYTRYEYPNNGIQSKVYSTITDVNSNNTGDTADEVLSESWTDGAGRVRQARTEHPGSTGGYAGTLAEYDIMGRVKRSTVPTEVNSAWTPVGDDATRGYLWTENEYDWKGRTTRVINTDGTDKLYEYDGCGCAGGQVTTIKGEEIIETDWNGNNPNNLGRRTQKVYADILGRAYKTEILNWNSTVYSSTQTTFNGRDQATQVKRYAGTTSSSTYQTTTMTYDGHGRLSTRHIPQQDANTNTSYTYNKDDSIQTMTDARGATATYSYNNRGLMTQVGWTVPPTSYIAVAPTVSYTYDNIGNRTQMTDGMGTTTYTYNQLSQMTSETRGFTDTLADAPISGNKFKLEYNYTISGQLKNYKDPYGQQINYAHDKTGRLSSVTGSTSFNGITNYATSPVYTARGVLKSVSYGNGTNMNITGFNNKLQATGFEVKKGASYVMNKTYEFYGDGTLKKLNDQYDARFDRMNKYDHAGRIIEAKSAAEARGGTVDPNYMKLELPYRQSYEYNEFDNMTVRNNLHWGETSFDSRNFNKSHTYVNNRISGRTYDADGRAGGTDFHDYNSYAYYNSAGQMNYSATPTKYDVRPHYDGNGRIVKREKSVYYEEEDPFGGGGSGGEYIEEADVYFIRSSVLGNEVISEVNLTGKKLKTFVLAAGTTVAWQTLTHSGSSATEAVYFSHDDPSGMSRWMTNLSGYGLDDEELETAPFESDGLGGSVGLVTPYIVWNTDPLPDEGGNNGVMFQDEGSPTRVNGRRVSCVIDGVSVPCEFLRFELDKVGDGGRFGRVETYLSGENLRHVGRFTRTVTWEGTRLNEDGMTTSYAATRTWNIYEDTSWSVFSWQQTSKPASLNEEENKKLDKRLNKLINEKLSKDDCYKFLVGKLGIEEYEKLIETLKDPSIRFSANRSKDITVEDAGLYGENARRSLNILSDKKYTKDSGKRYEYKKRLDELDWSVSKWSRIKRIHAVLGRINGNRVIFYKSFEKITTILHENLHISTQLGDTALANQLGLKDKNGKAFNPQDTSESAIFEASRAISKALIDNKCTN